MSDLYQAPALALTILLLPPFGLLYYRTRDIRNLLWFVAFLLVAVRAALLYFTGPWALVAETTAWRIAEALGLVSAGLFLGSLSPLSFRVGRFRILYAIPFTVPLVLYTLLTCWFPPRAQPSHVSFWIFPALGFCSLVIGLTWATAKGSLPPWLGFTVSALFGGFAIWFYFRAGLYWPLILAESGTNLIAALLVISVFRRFSPGVVISFLGFTAWSLPILLLSHRLALPHLHLLALRLIVMANVVTALGLILLALENELAVNKAASEREHRIRRELQAYTDLVLYRRRVEDFDRQADHICQTVVANSRFQHAALLLLHSTGMYRLAGSAGLDGATVKALDALAARLPVAQFLEPGSSPPVVENSQAVQLDLRPWMSPGDDLERLRFTSAIAVPLHGRASTDGALLLAGMRGRDGVDPLRRDDLAPVEMLTARMQSVRSQTRMMEKLIDSEKYAGLGQLAGNVTQQLNNPLTVILGYAALLEESPRFDALERQGVAAISSAARAMRATLESLQRVARAPGGQVTAVSVSQLLADLEQLHRAEFSQRSIALRVRAAQDLPRVLCQPHQLRQAILHCLQYSMEALERGPRGNGRAVGIEAEEFDGNVRITIQHSGLGFAHPERAFEPLAPAPAAAGDTLELGLSVCASLIRENNGQVTALNLKPEGAAIVLELEGT